MRTESENTSTHSEQANGASSAETSNELSLFDHLNELRRRLIYSSLAILLASIVCFLQSELTFKFLTTPFFQFFESTQLIGTGPAEAFLLKLKVAVGAGITVASPFLFAQLWLFIAPGLYSHERKLAIPFVGFTSILFLVGAWFAYQIVLPFAFQFFKDEYLSIGIQPAIRIGELLPMTIKLILGFGLVFNMPVLAYFLGRLGLIDHLFLLKYFRHAIVVIFIVAAVLTPPDVVTQLLMAAPLVLLYLLSILILKYFCKKTTE